MNKINYEDQIDELKYEQWLFEDYDEDTTDEEKYNDWLYLQWLTSDDYDEDKDPYVVYGVCAPYMRPYRQMATDDKSNDDQIINLVDEPSFCESLIHEVKCFLNKMWRVIYES